MPTDIVQFGTSRFLQAHVDLFVSEASPEPRITVVQTTGSGQSARRVAAFNQGVFPVRLRGLSQGQVIDRTVEVHSVSRGLAADRDWPEIEAIVTGEARVLLSNTGDRGYELDPDDRPDGALPRSFPAKLTRLLMARHRQGGNPLDIYPCELISGNGDTLRRIVLALADRWELAPAFRDWAGRECRWVNSLVDRIVSTPIEPVGAVAEPYALWAIGAQPGLEPPCRHPDIVLTDRLDDYERLKLFILNLGHSALVEAWRRDGAPEGFTVRDAMADPRLRAALDSLYDQEVLPVFEAIGQSDEAQAYRATTLERFANPFLEHRLADIADNHDAKLERRFRPLIALAEAQAPDLPQPRLREALARMKQA